MFSFSFGQRFLLEQQQDGLAWGGRGERRHPSQPQCFSHLEIGSGSGLVTQKVGCYRIQGRFPSTWSPLLSPAQLGFLSSLEVVSLCPVPSQHVYLLGDLGRWKRHLLELLSLVYLGFSSRPPGRGPRVTASQEAPGWPRHSGLELMGWLCCEVSTEPATGNFLKANLRARRL